MKFKQLSTGAVLETNDEAVIAMMTASSAYAVIKPSKAKAKAADEKADEKADSKDAE